MAFLLGLIILIGGALRLYNLHWDLGTFPHPDERSTLLFYAPRMRMPEDTSVLLDPRASTLNPFWEVNAQEYRSYTYGHFPLYSLVLSGAFLSQFAPIIEGTNASPEVVDFFSRATTGLGYAAIGRALVALLDVLSIYLVFLIGRRLYGNWAGLLAAALSAFAVFHIQLAHFFAVDPISTTFILLTIYASLLIYDRQTTGAAVLTGVAIGLAVSSKYSSLPIVLVPLMASLLICQKRENGNDRWSRAIRLLFIAGFASFVTFVLTSPFVLLDFENFQRAVMDEQGDMVSGVADFPFTRQYRNTTAYLYFIEQQVKWGLGWPLGLLAFGGFAWALVSALRSKLRPGEAIILAWLVPYFGLNGLFLAKFMRYMSPVTPLVIVLGVGMLVAFGRWIAVRRPSLGRGLAVTIGSVILLATAIWAAMFVNGVYASEHSWVTTSRWIYENVPDGSCIAREHWEEGVPRDWAWFEPGMSAWSHGYTQPEMPMYDPDTQEKYQVMRDTLRNCDYLVIASNRMSRTLPRLSERYPMSTRYYEALFDGELGYELVYEHATPPQLGPFVIDDQPADESFTVYDHPHAFVFQKMRDLSDDEWFRVLGNSWQGAIHGYIGQPTLLMRLRGASTPPGIEQFNPADDAQENTWLQRPLREWPVVSDWRWNTAASQRPGLATFMWWLTIQIIGLVAFPITFLLFKRLRDKGYLLSKSLGLLLVSYITWILASSGLPANRLAVILGSLIVMALVSVALLARQQGSIVRWWREQWRFILIGELIFAIAFVLFVSFRAANPDLWQPWRGGEKMIEIGFLNAIVKSAYMPPYDPFFSGTFINYYYYGLFISGIMVKLTGIEPVVAFNLAVPMLAGLTAINLFSLAGNLTQSKHTGLGRSVVAGLLAVLFVVFFSNLDGMGQFLRNLAEVSTSEFSSAIPGLETLVHAFNGFGHALSGAHIREYDFWEPSRVIPFTINEFPFFSFLFADLHPHMIGIPFTVLFLSIAYTWLRPAQQSEPETQQLVSASPNPPLPADAAVGPGTFAVEIADPIGSDLPDTATVDEPPAPPFPQQLQTLLTTEIDQLRTGISFGRIWRWLAIPFVLGALAVINTWDLPTYLGLICLTFAVSRYRAGLRPTSIAKTLVLLAEMAAFGGLTLIVMFLIYHPFFTSYFAPDSVGLGLIKDKIPLDEFYKLWGFFLLVLLTWLFVQFISPQTRFGPLRTLSLFVRRWNVFPHLLEVYRSVVRRTSGGYRLTLTVVGILLFIGLFLLGLNYIVVGLMLPWLIIAFLLLLRWEAPSDETFVGLLAFTGLLVLLGVQFVFLRDFLGGGDHYRMNTYFKFFIQVWVMFGIGAAVVLPGLWLKSERWRWGWRAAWQGLVLIFIFSSLVYFVLGTRQRNDYRFPGDRPETTSLNGMDYMTVGQFSWDDVDYELKYDYEAIRWLQDNVSGTPVIAEAKIGYYREGGMRVAAYTGLPSPLGGLHQGEQHPAPQLGERDGLVNQFWFETDPNRLRGLIDQLEIEYVYVGQLERAIYGDQVLAKFDNLVRQGLFEVVFENEKTRIYRLVAS